MLKIVSKKNKRKICVFFVALITVVSALSNIRLHRATASGVSYINAEVISVAQGGTEISSDYIEYPDCRYDCTRESTYDYILPEYGEYSIKLSIADLDDSGRYLILDAPWHYSASDQVYSASELAAGVEVIVKTQDFISCLEGYCAGTPDSWSIYNVADNDNISYQRLKFQKNSKKVRILYLASTTENREKITANLSYVNFPDKTLTWLVNPLFHDESNPLALQIKGENYIEDKVYDISINAHYYSGSVLWDEVYSVPPLQKTGAEINAGFSITLDNYTMQYIKYQNDHGPIDFNRNDITIRIGQGVYELGSDLSYFGKASVANIYGNGEVLSSPLSGVGGTFMADFSTGVPREKFNNLGLSSYIVPQVGALPKENVYTYTLYYGDMPLGGFGSLSEVTQDSLILATKQVTGKQINDGVVGNKLTNPNDYDQPTYVSVISDADGNTILLYCNTFHLSDEPIMDGLKLQSDDKDIYYKSGYTSYITTNTDGLKVAGVPL